MDDGIVTRWLSREDIAWKTVSYAQNHEDILLTRVFGKDHAGFYVDVGANDPVFHSVTNLLSQNGWRGINIEPTPGLHARLVEHRPDDVNLNVGIADAEGTLAFFEVPSPLHGWSTFLPELAESYLEVHGVASTRREIEVTTLDRVFERHVTGTVDVLKVDAEGFERQVLSGLDLSRWRPRVILIEAAWCDLWEGLLDRADYVLAAFDGINRFYVRGEDRGLLPAFVAPVNILDEFIPHEFVRLLDEQIAEAERLRLQAGLDPHFHPLGPTVRAFAYRLQGVALKNPGLAGMIKRAIRMVGGRARRVGADEAHVLPAPKAGAPGRPRHDRGRSEVHALPVSPTRPL